jgi:hypothetical protein
MAATLRVFALTENQAPDDVIQAPRFESGVSDTIVQIKLYPAGGQMGPVKHYFIIVVTDEQSARQRPDDFNIDYVSSITLILCLWYSAVLTVDFFLFIVVSLLLLRWRPN